MTNFFKLISIFILCSQICYCQKMVTGNDISATESRNLNGSFNSIEVSTGIDLYLTQSQTTSISVKADKNIMEFINTEIEGETLKLLEHAAEQLYLSPRACHRILKVSRTIADLDQAGDISSTHIAEAIAFRRLSTAMDGY